MLLHGGGAHGRAGRRGADGDAEGRLRRLDGLFQQALLGYLCGDEGSLDELADQVRTLMPILVPS